MSVALQPCSLSCFRAKSVRNPLTDTRSRVVMKCSSVLNDENERVEEASNWPSVPLQIAIDGRSPSQYSGECHEEKANRERGESQLELDG